MTGIFGPHPEDIAAEKNNADQLRRKYKNRVFGGLRNFRALRQQSPGVIAEFIISSAIAITVLLTLYHDLNVQGLLPTVWFCIKFILIIVLSFWVGSRIWRLLGVSVRDRVRYVVKNIWALLGMGIFAAGVVAQVFFPDYGQPQPESVVEPAEAAPVVAVEPEPEPVEETPSTHVLPPYERVFQGRGWFIVRNNDFSYAKALVKEASARCKDLGEDWKLADEPDFRGLEFELIEGGHVGSFWTASKKTNSNLDYFLNEDGSSHFRWALSGNDSKRIVMCVASISIS